MSEPSVNPVASSVLRVVALDKRFRAAGESIDVLSGLNLQLAAGQTLALMGPSGSGKSTLLNIISGLESWDQGQVELFGQLLPPGDRQWTDLRRRAIATVFQEANLMPALSLADNVRLRASLAGQPRPDVGGWLERLGLSGLAERFPDQVSGGQRQRVALAMAFAMKPQLILADEPTGSLDRHTAEQVADTLFRFRQQTGCPMILATHDPTLAARCDQTFTRDMWQP